MSVLIDPPTFAWRGRLWSHLVSDESYEELHEFASMLGLARERFQRDHYDVPEALYERAVALGALEVSSKALVKRLLESGLRRR
ncbi:MAG: DUF4031 domain-containing protein [Actinomycetota bacterium]